MKGYEANQSWVDNSCDTWDSVYGWDRAPCSACSLSNIVDKNVEFQLRGLCDRTRDGNKIFWNEKVDQKPDNAQVIL